MVINAALGLLISLLDGLFDVLSFLPLPSGVSAAFTTGLGWVAQGCKFLAAYTHFSYLLSC